jgi:hypothetical protein
LDDHSAFGGETQISCRRPDFGIAVFVPNQEAPDIVSNLEGFPGELRRRPVRKLDARSFIRDNRAKAAPTYRLDCWFSNA